MPSARLAVALSLSLVATAAASKATPVLKVGPVNGLMDAPFNVTLAGARPGARVEIHSIRRANDGSIWTGIATSPPINGAR